MAEHHLDGSVTQSFWDHTVEPRLVIRSGDTVVFDCPEPLGQVTPEWVHEDMANLDKDLILALVGSVFVEGAEAGDTLQVEILDMKHCGWGWGGHSPGFALLAEDFDFNYLHHWRLEGDRCHFGVGGIVVPFEPMIGTLGVGPREPGRFDTMPPGPNAGNVDISDLGIGATVWMPVFVEGALFACGDCHSAQGDGEVCGTGIESPMEVTLRLSVRKDLSIPELQFQAPSPLSKADTKGYHAVTAHGPDLMENARNAVREMIKWLVEHHALTPSQAYTLCGAACDLKLSQVVDAPNWIVTAYMPLGIFPG